MGQSEFFGSFLVITCWNAYLGQKRWAGGLGWPAGREPRIDLGKSILVPGTPRPRYSHVSLTVSFHHIPLPSNESLFCLSNWVKYVLLAAKTSSPSVKQELGQVTRSNFQMLPNPPGLPFSPRFSLPTLKVAVSKLHEITEAGSLDSRNENSVKIARLVGGVQRGPPSNPKSWLEMKPACTITTRRQRTVY